MPRVHNACYMYTAQTAAMQDANVHRGLLLLTEYGSQPLSRLPFSNLRVGRRITQQLQMLLQSPYLWYSLCYLPRFHYLTETVSYDVELLRGSARTLVLLPLFVCTRVLSAVVLTLLF